MEYLKLFESYFESGEYDDEQYRVLIKEMLGNLVEGYSMKIQELDILFEYFDNKLPDYLLHSGPLYRYIFFKDDYEDRYEKALEIGVSCRKDYFLRCTKGKDNHDILLQQVGAGYKYYIVFDVQYEEEDMLFDVNAVCEYFNVDNFYEIEEEVIIECSYLHPENIIDYGLVDG